MLINAGAGGAVWDAISYRRTQKDRLSAGLFAEEEKF
jgi:hypothetical protein